MTTPRPNCWKIDRIAYEPIPDSPNWDWLCVLAWLAILLAVVSFWGWVVLGRFG